ncbi:acid protease [Apiospora aurea]|uniref:Acid protease n=1 Tax=Apiospora aurea TaxID=335848 RepID=A0ABR1Q4R5_9PEZI
MWYTPGPFGLATVGALGNPPQPFRLYVDLIWDTLFVPNASLSTQYCSPGVEMFRYRANESSTADPSDLGWYYIGQNLVDFSGSAALDTFRVGGGGLRVERQPFVAVEHAQPEAMIDLWIGYDGVLGLSPRWDTPAEPTASRLPSPWAHMVRDGALDDNVFAIEVPRAARGGFDEDDGPEVGPTVGAITFGGVAEKYRDAEFAPLPLVRDDDRVWAVAAQSVR